MVRMQSMARYAIMACALAPRPCDAQQPHSAATSSVSISVRILPRPKPPAYSIFHIANANARHISTSQYTPHTSYAKQDGTLIVRHSVTRDSCSIGATLYTAQDDSAKKKDPDVLVMLTCDESLPLEERITITTKDYKRENAEPVAFKH